MQQEAFGRMKCNGYSQGVGKLEQVVLKHFLMKLINKNMEFKEAQGNQELTEEEWRQTPEVDRSE